MADTKTCNADPIVKCSRCRGEGIVAGPRVCPACEGEGIVVASWALSADARPRFMPAGDIEAVLDVLLGAELEAQR